MYEIIENLFLANFADAKANCPPRAFVVNCTKNFEMISDYGTRVSVHDDMSDDAIFGMLTALPSVTKSIEQVLTSKGVVVVHCRSGQQRSACVVCAYLMKFHGYTLDDAIKLVKSKKKDALRPRVNFMQTLLLFKQRYI
jgi:protein-tyrosine phosphatase